MEKKNEGNRFLTLVTQWSIFPEEIREIKVNAIPKSTQNATKYGVRLFKGKSTSSASLTILF